MTIGAWLHPLEWLWYTKLLIIGSHMTIVGIPNWSQITQYNVEVYIYRLSLAFLLQFKEPPSQNRFDKLPL